MQENDQIPGKQTIWEHGLSVKGYTWDLINYIKYNIPLKHQWRIPPYIEENKKFLKKELRKFSKNTIDMYTLYHDCGKPRFNEIKESKDLYGNTGKICSQMTHSEISADIFKQNFPYKHHISELIRYDMMIHTLKSEKLEWFAQRQEAVLWMITGLAEVHSNADMFGGMESDSFKIKWKHITKRSCQVIKVLTLI